MGKKREQIDLLDLPPDERARICREIRAALEERVSAMKIPVSDDVIVANKTMLDALETKSKDKHCKNLDLSEKTSFLNALSRRVW